MNTQKLFQSKGQYIKGEWHNDSGAYFKSINPATAEFVWEGRSASHQQVNLAFRAAYEALRSWTNTPFDERVNCIKKFAAALEKNKNLLAQIISLETGKPRWEAQSEVSSVLAKVDISVQAYHERTGSKEQVKDNIKTSIRYKPQGVTVVLGAFNFPAHISNGHIIPALLAGNTILYKPSEYAPGVSELIMQFWDEAGLIPGVINCLQGAADVAKDILNQDIQGVYFTGSYQTGLAINKHFANRPEVILALEMGGNNPLVLEQVSDIKAAVYNTIQSVFITAGQRCTCARRLIIPSTKQGDKFLEEFINAASAIRVGHYDEEPQPFIGPVIGHQQAVKHLQDQETLIQDGGIPLLSMAPMQKATGFLSPGIIDMSSVSHPPDIEIFAPLVQIFRYENFEHAIAIANQTRYGLCAGLMSDSEDKFEQFYNTIRAGLINWNRPTTGASSNLPFGGTGLSGNHRPSAYFAADYCSYPVASMEQARLTLPETLSPGIVLD